jgi:predicted nucleic acid-binding protein
VIIDANVAVFWSVESPFAQSARSLLQAGNLSAPRFLLIESAQALLKDERAGFIDLPAVEHAIQLIEASITLEDDGPLIPDALVLSAQAGHSFYDCLYLALAIRRGVGLGTADRRLALVARSMGIEAQLVEAT